MLLSQLNYDLPRELIANSPVSPRDHSKLLVINRETASISHKHFLDVSDLLTSRDVLVFNNTKVFPARAIGKKESGGKVEVLFLKNLGNNVWEILGKGIPPIGGTILFPNFYAIVTKKSFDSVQIEVFTEGQELMDILAKSGLTPLPPYIDTKLSENQVREKYQTVYAKESGSAAAPTAGFHFTPELIDKLKNKGVEMEYVTLHVGAGTFLPIKEKSLANHKMHSEWFSLDPKTASRLNAAKAAGKRIISVGTTTTRVLESAAVNNKLTPKTGETDIFIYPPYKFKFVDGLITNFHLPHSTLLALISAFVSKPNLPAQTGTDNEFIDFNSSVAGIAYKEAIENKYRFYSFGDAMFIE